MIKDFVIFATTVVIVGLIVLYIAALLINIDDYENMSPILYNIIYMIILFITGIISYLVLNFMFC